MPDSSPPPAQRRTYQGSCHCGRVRFELDARLDYAVACNCRNREQAAAVLQAVRK